MMKKQRLNSRKIRNLKESPSETWPTRAQPTGSTTYNIFYPRYELKIAIRNKFEIFSVHEIKQVFQGRTVWFNTNNQGEQGEDEEEEGEELVDEVEPEVGPSLLTSISEDAEVRH